MSAKWVPGSEVARLRRTMTAERMRWYADALETLSHLSPTFEIAPPNIHTDDELAKANGLPARVADGMVSTNWVSSALASTFGHGYLEGGTLRTRYVKPIFVDDDIEVVIKVVGTEPRGDDGAPRLGLDISCVNQKGDVVTAGAASVFLR